eukprot:TRINITY_DN33628_c0_g1_i1.p4 TRINITY_DN33628_c0_g1~~TRINITY_DN33628_c0_g1_i1.p4  ORF type:complete len:112 (-),score=17.91 TRINITY_DN33628_c0_g1_i1:21-356(-)
MGYADLVGEYNVLEIYYNNENGHMYADGTQNGVDYKDTKGKFWKNYQKIEAVSYTHLRAHETSLHLVCRLLLEKKKQHRNISDPTRQTQNAQTVTRGKQKSNKRESQPRCA